MDPAEHWYSDNPTMGLDTTAARRILAEREVRTGVIVVNGVSA
jgi:hypothetical protein